MSPFFFIKGKPKKIKLFRLTITDGPGAVSKDSISNYIGKVSLYPITDSGKIFVEWVSTYESDSDSEVGDFCNPIYSGFLISLKSKF